MVGRAGMPAPLARGADEPDKPVSKAWRRDMSMVRTLEVVRNQEEVD